MKSRTQTWLIGIGAALLGGAAGAALYAQTMARFDVISSACVTVQQAVEKGWLTAEQVKPLGVAAGTELHRSYASVAGKLAIPENSSETASPDSTCSQFLLGVQESRAAAGR